MADVTEQNDLEGVTQHPGWSRIKQKLAAEWGPQGARYIGALERVANNEDPAVAAANLRMVIMVRREIETFFGSIENRVAQVAHKAEAVPTQSRRGSL